MAIERRQPLPAGRYWIDVFGDKFYIMEGWIKAAGDAVHVESQHLTPATGFDSNSGPPLLPGPDGLGNSTPQVMWYLFTTSKPLYWVGQVLGFPTIATADIQSKADTATRPPPVKGPLDDVLDVLPKGEGLGALALLAGLAWWEFGGSKR